MKSIPLLALCACLALSGIAPAAADAPADLVGRPLSEALLELRSLGLKIVFSHNVVVPEMIVEAAPAGETERQWLDGLLAPHGLTVHEGPNETLVIVHVVPEADVAAGSIRGRVLTQSEGTPLSGVRVRVLQTDIEGATDAEGAFVLSRPDAPFWTVEASLEGFVTSRARRSGAAAELLLLLERLPVIEEKLVVTPSRLSLLRKEPVGLLELSRDDIMRLPHLGDDFFRAMTLLPGLAGNDVSAQFHVRGSRRDETQILIDGQELYDAYHLKDFDSALSLVAPSTLSSAELTTGGFGARYGDRMSGVLEMNTLSPSGPTKIRVGAGILTAHVGGAGELPGERGSWLAEARRGATDLVGRLLGDEDPQYWDGFAKLDFSLTPKHSFRANGLYSGDKLDFQQIIDGEIKDLQTEYTSAYLWLTFQSILSSSAFVENAASVTRIDRDRRGIELEEDARFIIFDARDTEVRGFRQSWHLSPRPAHAFRFGLELRQFETSYDYQGTRDFENPLAVIRHDFGESATSFLGSLEDDHSSAHLSDRIRLSEALTAELGLRWDRHSLTDESQVSPRVNLAWATAGGVLRAAWGRFNQSQRPYELQVEDGDQTLRRVERSEHRVVGWERVFKAGPGDKGLAFRVEAYRREVRNPRPRYENLFEPINNFPEVEPDRVRVTPARSVAKGLELFLRGSLGAKTGWLVTYSLASTDDQIEGRRVKRLFDQKHGLNVDLDHRFGPHWRINLAWRFHTGWPTTPLALEPGIDAEGQDIFVPVLGPINSHRLGDYHRLDLRATREWQLSSGKLLFYVDVQNAYNRKNPAGFDFDIDEVAGTILPKPEVWPGLVPSAGISYEF